jgi:hypothetical protein
MIRDRYYPVPLFGYLFGLFELSFFGGWGGGGVVQLFGAGVGFVGLPEQGQVQFGLLQVQQVFFGGQL